MFLIILIIHFSHNSFFFKIVKKFLKAYFQIILFFFLPDPAESLLLRVNAEREARRSRC